MVKVLIVEDDRTMAEGIARHLSAWGMDARPVANFERVTEQFVQFDPQLVLMDISLPFMNGYHWCAEIRKISKTPILFLSSASDNMNIVMAMDMGGDDFIAKPFDLDVLTAKVRAMLRRAYDFGGRGECLCHGGLTLNLADGTAACAGESAALTRNEIRILLALMENAGRIVGRDQLMMRLWETDSYVDENTLSVNVNRLRKKLAALGLADYIETRKGLGYMVKA
ncbi:MAG: response regulator transcription factor [Clostridia bacterium]